jgi:2-oxoisovalerate dehydrogenase E1 component alpha subunit
MSDEAFPVIAQFDVRRRAYVAPDGSILHELPGFASERELVVAMYRAMVLARTFDLKAVALQRRAILESW